VPIYEFYCRACNHEFEQIVSFSESAMPSCPSCQSADVGRHMSRPAIHFKGSGWYITDSRNGNGKHSNNGASESTKAETKTDSAAKDEAGVKDSTSKESKSELQAAAD
jgi:putative FmdB family regulatory protein